MLFFNLSIAQVLIFLSADTFEHFAKSITQGSEEILIPEVIGQSNYIGPFYTDVVSLDQQTMGLTRKTIIPVSSNLEYNLSWILKKQNGFVGIGHCRESNTKEIDLLVVSFDSLMNPLKDSVFGEPAYTETILDIELTGDKVLLLTSASNDTTATVSIWEFNKDFTITKVFSSSPHQVVFYGSLAYNPNIDKILLIIQPDCQLTIIDYPNLTIDTIISYVAYPDFPGPFAGFLDNSTIYDTRCVKKFSAAEHWVLGFSTRTIEGILISDFTINDTAFANELANYNSIMFLSNDTIITCAMQSTDFMVGLNLPFLGINFSNSKIIIYAHSRSGKVYWSHTFGGDFYYLPKFILNGQDGYIYVLGTTYDWANYTPQTGFNNATFIYRIKASGPVTPIEESIIDQGRIRLMPNPAHATTTIVGMPDEFDRYDFELQIFDVSGRLQKKIKNKSSGNNVQINLAGLIKGMYFIHFILPCGEKVVRKLVKL